ncbi:hypothetical protein [Roseivivax halodurans]|uniref:hypothetical protein n=1 Tax=Roseivivax halodurans TaxID=93683 RepID=UPI001FCAA88B|nr:hypothetical protein [Roseivivax halodurans]
MFEKILQFASEHPNTLAAISGLGSALAALAAVLLSAYALLLQRRHNQLSVRPIAHFGYVDYENEIAVWLRNSGVGPMKIDAITVFCGDSKRCTTTLIEHMECNNVEGNWSFFSGNLKGKTLAAGSVLHLLKLEGDPEDEDYIMSREATRRVLLNIELKVTYSDIYNRIIGTEARRLAFFGRHYFDYNFETQTLSGR